MIRHISGRLCNAYERTVIIECGGIGYEVFVTINDCNELASMDIVFLHTTQIMKENSNCLYGFLQKEERAMFEKLITVERVGASLAMNCLSTFYSEKIKKHISEKNVIALCSIPKIGKKMAQTMIDKLGGKL